MKTGWQGGDQSHPTSRRIETEHHNHHKSNPTCQIQNTTMSTTNKEKTQFLIVRARLWSYAYQGAVNANNQYLKVGISNTFVPETVADKALELFDSRFQLKALVSEPLPEPIQPERCDEKGCALHKNHAGVHLIKSIEKTISAPVNKK